jgi:hypothetical protein
MYGIMKKKVDFRLDEELLELLDAYAKQLSTNRTAALARLIIDHCHRDTLVARHTLPEGSTLADLVTRSSLRNIAAITKALSETPLEAPQSPADEPEEIETRTYVSFDDI